MGRAEPATARQDKKTGAAPTDGASCVELKAQSSDPRCNRGNRAKMTIFRVFQQLHLWGTGVARHTFFR
jgi:hypothetical protein